MDKDLKVEKTSDYSKFKCNKQIPKRQLKDFMDAMKLNKPTNNQ